MGENIDMSISDDFDNFPSDENFKPRPFALLLMRQYEFPFGMRGVQFSFSFSFSSLTLFLPSYQSSHFEDLRKEKIVQKSFSC